MEWKELEVDNLPADILTGGYEFEYLDNLNEWTESGYTDASIVITRIYKRTDKYHYRKPEPKQPSHEEIIKMLKLIGDNPAFPTNIRYHAFEVFSYINKESSTIPPEAL